ncbi:MAG: NADH:ubiquinone reductase (Na(+)-transporting) subunit A [Flavobacteriaceae bacterium CG_4_8_14_3_um_filter_34_10]|nr:Na(+)-translocating NADH-quinone reductase subunit A [Flavobacteriia bacterium]OIP49257.1 MAG: NADH:ubiquinone reductase (Na(+)-transporting) subunit A [Flavobacteriaceae bacterium CG2_30_34_30]PIQ18773.1 MAG: NADH:ubiquinone reductase (Na(+)-transporting) subunit A [Flavobacteriaceae bacterium CG18_big_fil_WC_8_21_14_2_50_34_36]PIV49242.1 MAG: NADH:ubiquinone reductase (Na(+)-transporting) subunit A [Flavobacteriaceae bacterium CG02_land_8_20_14_3_00_34_13]PIX08540.1 MAG: NADH:ubiquinone re
MSKDIRITKGLDIRLVGESEKALTNAPRSRTFSIKPSDFHLITPKMVVKEGAKLQAGDEIWFSKTQENIRFVSPVSGTLTEIKRGAKRVITDLVITADSQDAYRDFGKLDVASAKAETIKNRLLEGGCWFFIKQRPYDVVANPNLSPKAIFISAFASGPLVADYNFTLQGKETQLQAAVTALSKLTKGKVHVGIGAETISPMSNLKDVIIHKISGPHPAGNVGTLINKIDPVNKGETVWTITPQDLVIIGDFLLTGKYNAERIVALSGSSLKSPKYYKTKIGAEVSTMVYDSGLNEENVRVISGGILSGKKVEKDGHLGFYDNTISVIPEGDDYEFFGWTKPEFNKISLTRALTFSWLTPKKKFTLNTNTNGEHRAFVQTGLYEQVFPLDIYPLQILKACMVEDLDAMEQLGMYEVAPEDFALTEFVCISKQPHQDIIRQGLDVMYKEIG